jgi:orotidine-5'-phosphate decarboxylase
MNATKQVARDTMVFGVTELTSIPESETAKRYGKPRAEVVHDLALELSRVGLGGVVVSPRDIPIIKGSADTRHLLTLVPGTRSEGAVANEQSNTSTPGDAVRMGADLIVVGREVTRTKDPVEAYDAVIHEVAEAQGVKIAPDPEWSVYDGNFFRYGFVRGVPPIGGYRWR